jgi:hypothetical protein
MKSKQVIKSLFLITAFSLGLNLTSCSDDGATKKVKTMKDPFQTTGAESLTAEKQKIYLQRGLTDTAYQAVLAKVKETEQEIKKYGGNFSYVSANYDKKINKAIIKDLVIDYSLDALVPLPIKSFDDTKTLEVDWYDEKNSVPYYVKASMLDVLVANDTFLQSQEGKDFSAFLTKLGVDYKKLNNLSDLTYEYDEKTGQIAVALNEDFNQLFTLRLVTRLDGISKQSFDLLGSANNSALNPGMLLGMLSAIRLQEIYLKMKMEKTIEEVFVAMPEEDAKQARKDYAENKNMSEMEIKKRFGNGYSSEQIKQYRTVWVNFLEHKQPIIISIKPDIPQAFSALFSSFMMAQQNTKMASGLVEQLKLTITN